MGGSKRSNHKPFLFPWSIFLQNLVDFLSSIRLNGVIIIIIIISLLNHMTNAHVYNDVNTNIIRTWYIVEVWNLKKYIRQNQTVNEQQSVFAKIQAVQEVVQSDDLDLLTAWHLQAWCLRSINDLNSDCQTDYSEIGCTELHRPGPQRSHSYSARPLRYALLKTRCNTSFWSWVINTRNKPAKRTEFIYDDGFINRVKCKYIYFNFIYLLNLSVQPEKDKKLINSADIRRNKKKK